MDILESRDQLAIPDTDFRLVTSSEYEFILNKILTTFTTEGIKARNYPWLWDNLLGEAIGVQLPDNLGPDRLSRLVPDEEKVWFLAEDWEGNSYSNYWLYEGNTKSITAILNNMYGLEYYLVSRDFSWLLCENHHAVFVGVGEPIVTRLKSLKEELV